MVTPATTFLDTFSLTLGFAHTGQAQCGANQVIGHASCSLVISARVRDRFPCRCVRDDRHSSPARLHGDRRAILGRFFKPLSILSRRRGARGFRTTQRREMRERHGMQVFSQGFAR
ncbi:hypothetical protein G3N96_02365 [Burkholderia sp. Se-20373]|uniref:hypothetical protein n=1 Tax=Burkholderia sp. Se-20373 TaxID=2703898 RepID=UPI00197E589B|nr:hypothetical protein [Burkholderia sp. Se-20373]MBN3744299.1 hypothetical protein [Burkholderia sp. Se-20373]